MISTKVLNFFVSSKKISCFRTYISIKNHFNCKVNMKGKGVAAIAQLLGTSKDNVRKHIKQLHKLEFLQKGKNDWYHIVGNKRFSDKTGDKPLRGYDFKIADLKDVKRFRTLLYTIEYENAAVTYKKATCINLREIVKAKSQIKYLKDEKRQLTKEYKETLSKENTDTDLEKNSASSLPKPLMKIPIDSARYVVSTSFVSQTTNRHQSTITKHRLRAKKYGFVSYKRTFDVLRCTDDFIIKTSTNTGVNMPLFKFHNSEINSNTELCKILSCSNDESLTYANVFPLKDNKGRTAAIVSEEAPEMIFNIKTHRIRSFLTVEEKMQMKQARMKIKSMKN